MSGDEELVAVTTANTAAESRDDTVESSTTLNHPLPSATSFKHLLTSLIRPYS